MKVMLVLMVLIAIGLFLAFKLGGIGGFDPARQAEDLKTLAQPGTKWSVIVAKFPPRKMRGIGVDQHGIPAQGPQLDYQANTVETFIKNAEQFLFDYRFSGDHAYQLSFSPTGELISCEKQGTLLDPLNLRGED